MKRSIRMLALLGVLAVCIAGYALISGTQQEETGVTEEAGTFVLGAWAQEDITGLRWTNENGEFDFVREDGVWTRQGEAAFPVNQTALDALAGKMAELTGTREITNAADAADYGLSEPAFSVTVTGADGEITYAMGDETPFGDGYYLSLSDREAIYTVSSSLASVFNKTLTQLCELEELPQADSVTRLTVSGALDAAYDEAADAWTDTVEGEPLDADDVEALIAGVKNIEWNAVVTASATEEELFAWALDEAQAKLITLMDGEETVLTLCIGGEDEDGNRYAKLPDSTMVYTVYAEDVEELLDAGVDTLWRREPVTAAFDTLASAELAFDGGTVSLVREKAEEPAEEADDEQADGTSGEEDGAYGVTVNGAADESGEAESLWALVCALKGTQRIAYAAAGDPVLSISWTQESGRQSSVSLYAYDVDAYVLPITDTHGMLVSADDADRIIRTLKQMNTTDDP